MVTVGQWNMKVTRVGIQKFPGADPSEAAYGKVRTLSEFAIALSGEEILSGWLCEANGPGTSVPKGNPGRRILPAVYRLSTHYTGDFKSQDYNTDGKLPRPGVLVDSASVARGGCGRKGICVHPAHVGAQYLSSIGCLNPVSTKLGAQQYMDPADSYDLVVKIINSLAAFEPAIFEPNADTFFLHSTIQIIGDPMNVID